MGKKVQAQFIKQPKFYKNFHCIGGSCPVSCCHRWRIDYRNDEVEKLKNAECSDSLKKLINESFEPYPQGNKMMIKLTDEKKCPFHNEEGLCAIQKELGEKYLSFVCTSYPRKSMYYGNYVLRSCVVSCPHVLSMICSDEDGMSLENVLINKEDRNTLIDSSVDFINNPALKYRGILFDFFYELLSDKSRSIETSIVLGAMAAQKLDEFIKQGKYDRIPDVIKALKPQLNNPVQIEKLENVKPNLSLKANFSAGLLKLLNNASIYANVFENGIPSEEKYNRGMEEFRKCFHGTPNYMRNIALNLYITNKMPYRDNAFSLFENYCYFVSEIAVIKFLLPAVAIHYVPVEEQIERAISFVDRSFTHNDENVKKVLDYMKAFKCTTPAYLLGIIK